MLNFKMQAQKHTERENKAVPGKETLGLWACLPFIRCPESTIQKSDQNRSKA